MVSRSGQILLRTWWLPIEVDQYYSYSIITRLNQFLSETLRASCNNIRSFPALTQESGEINSPAALEQDFIKCSQLGMDRAECITPHFNMNSSSTFSMIKANTLFSKEKNLGALQKMWTYVCWKFSSELQRRSDYVYSHHKEKKLGVDVDRSLKQLFCNEPLLKS